MDNQTGIGIARNVMGRKQVIESFKDALPLLKEMMLELEDEEDERLINVARKKEHFRRIYSNPVQLQFLFKATEQVLFPENPALANVRKWITVMETEVEGGVDVEAVKDGCDIAEIASEFTDVRRQGQKARCLCPFHQDSQPSLVLYKNNTYHCFACGANGDVIDLVMEFRKCGFLEALKFIHGYDTATKAGSTGTRRGDC